MAVYNVKSLSFTKGDNTYNIDAGSSYYAVCSTAGATQTKTVTIDEITALEEGLSVRIIFSNEQLYDGVPKLQINSLAAANIQSVAGINGAQYMWKAGEVIDLVYNGTNWVIVGRGATPSTRIIQVNTTVTNESGAYTATINDTRITSDMKAISLEIQNPYAFYGQITVTCNNGSVTFSCPDVSGTSDVTINIVKAALDGVEVTSAEFDRLDAAKVDKTDFNTAIAGKQNITDNSLTTTDKTIVGAINENLSSIFDLQEGLAIIANGDTHASISSGQFVYVRNHATLPDGLYKATSTIGANAALTTSNLADTSGALNDVQAQITTLNNNVGTVPSGQTVEGQITALNSNITSQTQSATINTDYLSEGSVTVYDLGNLVFIQLADIKFKVDIANSSVNNNIELITLPIQVSNIHIVFAITPLNPNDNVVRLRAQYGKITPWWSTIKISQGEGYCGSVVIKKA